MLIISKKENILINNFNLDEKYLTRFKNFNQKDHIASIFQKSGPNWNYKKFEAQLDFFGKKMIKRLIKPIRFDYLLRVGILTFTFSILFQKVTNIFVLKQVLKQFKHFFR